MTDCTLKIHPFSARLLPSLGQFLLLFNEMLSEQLAERIGEMLPDFQTQQRQTVYALESILNRLDTSASQTELLENVNQTNQMLGEAFYDRRIIQPMVRGLFPMMDLLDQAIAHDVENAHLPALRTQLEQFLAQYDIQAYRHETGSDFNPQIMKPLQRTETDDPSLDGLLAESLQCGFLMGQQILRLEAVSLYRFDLETH